MTSSIPSGFSFEDLQSLMKNAVPDVNHHDHDECNCNLCDRDDVSEERISKLATKICDDANEFASGPLLHKVIALTIISRLITWHKAIGDNLIADGEIEAGTAWHRDAGQLQIVGMTLANVGLGPDDFTCDQDDD
jgi:hypothetical protein|tara:strand:- start:194 stop:598 length:405 start_codon:yes stop_codon:yes gene_type:complete